MANGAPSPTPAADWSPRALKELPSGRRARLREKLSLRALVRRGDIDLDELTLLTSGGLRDPQRALELEALLLSEMFVEPVLVVGEAKAKRGQVHIDDLDDDDASFVLELALGGAPDLATFRNGSERAEPGADGAGVEQEPERAAGAGGGEPRSARARSRARAAPRKRSTRGAGTTEGKKR